MKNVIYKIINLIDNKSYIGSTIKFNNRKRNHIYYLERGDHHNNYLQNAWNKYGKENFKFEIIDTVRHKEELEHRENYWFSKFDFDKELYNICPVANSCLDRKHSEETIEKIKAKIPRQEDHYMFGKTVPTETKEKISKALKGENAPWYGKKIPLNARIKMSKAKKGKPNILDSKPVRQIDVKTGEVLGTFASAAEAFRQTKIYNISAVCNKTVSKVNGKDYIRYTAGGYKWEYI